jgi:hypothetical protein
VAPVVPKDADTVLAAVMLSVQVPVPVQPPPDQPAKVSQVVFGEAVSVTVVPVSIAAVQPSGEPEVHAMPGPLTVPCPSPVGVTVSVNVAGWNVAVTVFAFVMVTEQLAPSTTVQPDQLLKIEPGAGAARSVTVAPFATVVEHPVVAPGTQEIPGPLTVPLAP